jgi:hypothetical protein
VSAAPTGWLPTMNSCCALDELCRQVDGFLSAQLASRLDDHKDGAAPLRTADPTAQETRS